jgi:rubrerythrin
MLFMADDANGTNQEESFRKSTDSGSTVKCNLCGTLFPREYKKCPKCKTPK